MRLIRKCARFFAELVRHLPETENRKQLDQELLLLGAGRKNAVEEYHTGKWMKLLLMLGILLPLGAAVVLLAGEDERPISGNGLSRDSYDGRNRTEEVLVRAEGETEGEEPERNLSVSVKHRKYTAAQARERLEKAREELEEGILSANDSADAVRESLWFPSELADGSVKVNWLTMPYGMIGEDGSIVGEPDEKGNMIDIRAELCCEEETLLYEQTVNVLPAELTAEERFWRDVSGAAAEADEKQVHSPSLTLPQEVSGRVLTWRYPSTRPGAGVLLLIPLLLVLAYAGMDQRIHEQAKKRSDQLLLDYQDFLWKLSTLTGAGMSIRAAFMRIAFQYQKEHTGGIRYVYEEVLYTCREMKTGVPEGKAYEAFGRRCGLPCYVKLGSVLAANLQKGSKGLPEMLSSEAAASLEDLRREARKLGERAGTKMLFPMMIMLDVVLVILMAPALRSL